MILVGRKGLIGTHLQGVTCGGGVPSDGSVLKRALLLVFLLLNRRNLGFHGVTSCRSWCSILLVLSTGKNLAAPTNNETKFLNVTSWRSVLFLMLLQKDLVLPLLVTVFKKNLLTL